MNKIYNLNLTAEELQSLYDFLSDRRADIEGTLEDVYTKVSELQWVITTWSP